MIRRDTARRLCTDREFELVEASMPAPARQLTASALRQKIERARNLRDKYRDLAKRQRLEARGKRGPRGSRPAQGNENTERKAAIFDEVLERLQAALKTSGTAPQPPRTRSAPKKAAVKKSAKKSAVKKSAAKKSAAKKSAAKKSDVRTSSPTKPSAKTSSQTNPRQRQDAGNASRTKTQRAHGRAAQGRSQSRRDNRGR